MKKEKEFAFKLTKEELKDLHGLLEDHFEECGLYKNCIGQESLEEVYRKLDKINSEKNEKN